MNQPQTIDQIIASGDEHAPSGGGPIVGAAATLIVAIAAITLILL